MTGVRGSTAPAERPDTREMVIIHDVFRRLFGDLPGLIREATAGDTVRAGVLADMYTELAGGLHHHHSGEDEMLWPLLLERVGAEDAAVVNAEEQHQRLHDLLERAKPPVEAYRSTGSAAARDALATTVEELDAVLREHMSDEEQSVLPLVERHLSAAEWEALGERQRAGIPKDRLLIQLGWILDGLPAAERAAFLKKMPLAARIAWRLVGRRKFEQERRRAYGL
jgi:iron-sulfur cluster repair protein YtfE (RIC family)